MGVINSVVSLFYYARVVRAMYLTKGEEAPVAVRTTWGTTIVALAVPTVVLGIYWAPIYDLVTVSLGVGR